MGTVEYEDLRLVIEGSGGQYRASVVESPAGESMAPETVDWVLGAERLEKEIDLRRKGAALFDTFVSGQVRELYRESAALTQERRKGLRIKLLIDPPELSTEPWELLYDSRNRCYVGLSSRTPIVRHRKIPQAVEPLAVEPPLRILGLIANPLAPGLPALEVEKERGLIEKALAELRKAGLVELTWLDGGSWEELQRAMWQNWHVFHYIGHGDYDPAAGEGFLLLEDGDGGPHRLPATDLSVLLRGEADVRLAVLNSCKGATGDGSASSSTTADALIQGGMGGVVAMQNPISDKAAITFSRILYLGLASGLPLDAAVSSARVAMKIEHAKPIEWWTPVLHMRAPDGVLFKLPPAPAAKQDRIPGMEYLGPDLDVRLTRTLARRRWHQRAIYGWMLAPIPLLGYLAAAPVSSVPVTAAIDASGVSFRLSAQRELFADLPRVKSFSASRFSLLQPPEASLPVRPGPGEEARVDAVSADDKSWISLQPWTLPAGSDIGLDQPGGANPGEYALSLATGAGRTFHATLVNRIRYSRFGAAAKLRDYGDNSVMGLITSDTSLSLELQFLHPERFRLPTLAISSLAMTRQGFNDAGPLLESTVLKATVAIDGLDTLVLGRGINLGLQGLQNATIDQTQLNEQGLSFVLNGRATDVTVNGNPLSRPSRLERVTRDHSSYLWLGALAYLLILLVGVLSWRTSHAIAK